MEGRNPPRRDWNDGHGVVNYSDTQGTVIQTTAVIWKLCQQYGAEAELVAQVIINREVKVGFRIRTLHHMLVRGHHVSVADDDFSAIVVDDKQWEWDVLDHVSNFRM